MLLDQLAFAPVFTTSVLSLVGLLQGHTPDEVVVKLKASRVYAVNIQVIVFYNRFSTLKAQYIDVMKTGYSVRKK